MDDGEQSVRPPGSRWTTRRAVVAYVLAVALVVVATFWAARAGRAEQAPTGSTPTASPSASSAGTPRFTIELTSDWQSAPDPVGVAATQLVAAPEGLADPVVLVGSPQSGYARVDPSSGSWEWRTPTRDRPQLGWAGSVAVFGDPTVDRAAGGSPLVFGVDDGGRRTFSSRVGAFVTSTPSRVVVASGRSVTGLTPTGHVAWTSRLPAGVATRGQIAGYSGPAAVPGSPGVVAFASSRGPGRVATVDVVDGTVRSFAVPADDPRVWSTAWGVLVTDPGRGSVSRYDSGGSLAWSQAGSGLTVLAAQGDVALVDDPGSARVELVRLQDGTTVWSSDPLEGTVDSGALTVTGSGQVLVSLAFSDPAGHPDQVIAADPTTGQQLWGVERRSLLGTWRGYVLFAETNGPGLSALDLRTGTTFATLNAVVPVLPALSAVVDDTLVYVDPATGIAHGVRLSDHP